MMTQMGRLLVQTMLLSDEDDKHGMINHHLADSNCTNPAKFVCASKFWVKCHKPISFWRETLV